MQGVILFADDKIQDYFFDEDEKSYMQSEENKLFKELSESFPVLAVKTLEAAETSIKTIGSFNALILDWQFNERKDVLIDKGDDTSKLVQLPSIKEDETFLFLMRNEIYSLIYIYSTAAAEIKEKYSSKLEEKFPGRVYIFDKKDIQNTTVEKEKILKDIAEWQEKNVNLSVPILWSQTIIQSVQKIFTELASADINWILNLHQTASSDGVNPEIEVINLLQNLLSEKIITSVELSNEIKLLVTSARKNTSILKDGASIARLFQRIYYTDLSAFSIDDVPVMTGDIFLLDETSKTYGIIISPECDIQDICNSDSFFELLKFKESDFNLQNFTSLFGANNTKVNIDNGKIVSSIKSIIKRNFTAFSKACKPVDLYKKGRLTIFEADPDGITSMRVEKGAHKLIEEDYLVKLFVSQFEILINKNIAPGIKSAINDQASEQNSILLNELLMQAYNQTEKRIHLIPCFNFDTEFPNRTAVIDFRYGKGFITYSDLKATKSKRICKLNNPFIPELRQRYLAYYGRVGVPKIPNVLREYNLQSFVANS